MTALIYVALGGALGASARYLLTEGLKSAYGTAFPYGTLTANVVGSFLMGILVALLMVKISASESLRLFLGVGLLGGFTTFSAFSIEAITLLERKAFSTFSAYVGLSVGLSLLAVCAGLWLGRKVWV